MMTTNRCTACGLKEAPYYDDEGRCPLCLDDASHEAVSRTTAGGRASTIPDKRHLSRLQRAALEAVSEHGSMRAAAKALGTNHGVISMALDGHETDAAYKALGVRKTDDYVVAFHMRDPDVAAALRRALDTHGSRREVGQRLASGELVIVERGE